ncbi:PQQ-binding-like beta-propeller repeat protein [Nocardiopsis sp. HNM0947]|uniref:PQQ-binding-like beta-propeller repeat protein n=1 Tax=Nocardiopsis coralli TaxID=2772213 RepID=A0ABR9PBK4_9ACTN|nr:PQQ-binding-like beta-propeller repeat protein [Nocardiopsis coralli]MBE3001226.1 PQQ-binding-like beta-propeller repeat protein [Nocardiopsis coralli]
MRAAIAWVGLGLIAGALVWAAVSVVLYFGHENDGITVRVTISIAIAVLFGLATLVMAPRWRAEDPAPDRDARMIAALAAAGVGVVLAVLLYAEVSEGSVGPVGSLPAQLHAWLVIGAVVLGTFLMLPLADRPSTRPLSHSFPAFTAGTLSVVLCGGLVHTALFPQVGHRTAGDLGEPAPTPETVTEVGWSWEPEHGTSVEGIEVGTHGPLVALSDGLVSLDGTDGSEIWSYRLPASTETDVEAWVDGDRVVLVQEPLDGSDDATADVLDLETGEPLPGLQQISQPRSGDIDDHVVARTGKQVVHVEFAERVEDPTVLRSGSAETGEQQWSTSLPSEDGLACYTGTPEWLHGLLVTGHLCEEAEGYDGGMLGYTEDGDEAQVEHTVVALDPETGEQVWERSWTGPGDVGPPQAASGGHPTEGADPVIVVETGEEGPALVLDPATGEDAVTLPERAEDLQFAGFLGADSESATYMLDREDGLPEIERATADGAPPETAETGGFVSLEMEGAVALGAAALTLESEVSAGAPHPRVQVHGFEGRRGTVTEGGISLTREDEGFPGRQMVAVPGAVVAVINTEVEAARVTRENWTEEAVRGLTH